MNGGRCSAVGVMDGTGGGLAVGVASGMAARAHAVSRYMAAKIGAAWLIREAISSHPTATASRGPSETKGLLS